MKKFLVVVLVLLLIVLGVGLVSPTEYSIDRSVVIDAPPAAIHAYVGDLTRWSEWSPWDAADETIVTTFGDKTSGVGASQTWTSKDGDGELTFTTCDVENGIAYDMAFIHDGERAPAKSAMTYTVVDGGTQVTWSMEGDWKGAVPPVADGWMQVLTPVMIGGMFDDGLEKLRVVVEASGT